MVLLTDFDFKITIFTYYEASSNKLQFIKNLILKGDKLYSCIATWGLPDTLAVAQRKCTLFSILVKKANLHIIKVKL